MLLQIRKTWIGLLAWQIGMNLRNFWHENAFFYEQVAGAQVMGF